MQDEFIKKSNGIYATGTSTRRRSSFTDMCQSASKRTGLKKNQVGDTRRPDSVPESSPIAEETKSEKHIELLLPHEGTSPSADPGRHGSVDGPYFPRVLKLDAQYGSTAIAVSDKNGDDANELIALRELVQHQKEDLETAALIGQRLLDSAEELSADLEAAREEKWSVDCEKEALRCDLERATQRCEQMLQDTTIAAGPTEEPEVAGSYLWSPAAGVGTGAFTSFPNDRPRSPTATTAYASTDDENQEQDRKGEIGRLRQTVESLEQLNTTLKEELLEAHLEATALRRRSVEHGEAVRDQERRELIGAENQQRQLCVGRSSPDYGGDEAGDRQPRTFSSSSLDRGGETPLMETEAYGDGEPPVPREDNGKLRQAGAGETPVDSQQEGSIRRERDDSGEDDRTIISTASVTTSVSSLRRQSSAAFKDAEEQAELIEALRGQVAQLRLEVNATTPAAGAYGRGIETTALYQRHCRDIGQVRSRSERFSDDSGGSDRGGDTREEGVIGESGGGPDHYGGSGGDGDRIDDDTTNALLRARIGELLSELEAAKRAFEALRQRARQDQATSVELQRELLRFHGTRSDSNVVDAGVAHVSAGTTRPAAQTARHDLGGERGSSNVGVGGGGGGGRGKGSEHRNDCLGFQGLGWLNWLWRTVFRRGDGGEGLVDGIGDMGSGCTEVQNGTGVSIGCQILVGKRGSSLNRGERKMA